MLPRNKFCRFPEIIFVAICSRDPQWVLMQAFLPNWPLGKKIIIPSKKLLFAPLATPAVLLSALVKRFGVSCMWDFYNIFQKSCQNLSSRSNTKSIIVCVKKKGFIFHTTKCTLIYKITPRWRWRIYLGPPPNMNSIGEVCNILTLFEENQSPTGWLRLVYIYILRVPYWPSSVFLQSSPP